MPEVPDTDYSGRLLDAILGNGWELIIPGKALPAETAASTFVFPMFQMFNGVVLTATAIMVGYIFCFGVVGTANEGVPLGRRYHSMWVPIRAALGVSWLVPVPHISILQIILLTCISWSITFANDIWSAGLDYLTTNTGFTVRQVTEDTAQVENLASGIMDQLIVQHYYNYKLDIPTVDNTMYEIDTEDEDHIVIYYFYPPDTKGIVLEDMGRVVLKCEDPDGLLCWTRYNAIEQLVRDLVPISSDNLISYKSIDE